MTCKDCLHYDVCVIVEYSEATDEDYLTEFGCDYFEDRTNWVEQKHGRWEFHRPDSAGNRKPKCSVCGEYHLAWWSDYTHCKYCPNCGAKMDE